LGEVFDTAQVTVNGHRPRSTSSTRSSTSPDTSAAAGTPSKVEVATTLFNRLRVVQPNAYTGNRQNCGPIGPVSLIPG
jgi:hypothetical protein